MSRIVTRPARALGALLLAALATTAACASSPQGEGEGDESLQVVVMNNLMPPTSLTVWIEPRTGTRQLVGSVTPSDTATLGVDLALASGQYVLVAETTAGSRITSTPFTLGGPSRVTWDLFSNIATVAPRGSE